MLLNFFFIGFRQFYYNVSWRRSFEFKKISKTYEIHELWCSNLSRFASSQPLFFRTNFLPFSLFSSSAVSCALLLVVSTFTQAFSTLSHSVFLCASDWIVSSDLSLSPQVPSSVGSDLRLMVSPAFSVSLSIFLSFIVCLAHLNDFYLC